MSRYLFNVKRGDLVTRIHRYTGAVMETGKWIHQQSLVIELHEFKPRNSERRATGL